MDSDEATKKIRKLAEDPENIVFASQEGVDSFDQAWVDEFLLDCVGVSGAWISDASELSDFTLGREDRQDAHEKIEKKYGVDVRGMDNLLEIFRKIHGTNTTPQ